MEKLCLPRPLPGGAPFMVYLHDRGVEKMQTFTTIWPNKDNKSYLREIPELKGKFVLASSFGWLLLQDARFFKQFCLWNPVTLETICLPLLELHIDVEITTCTITSITDHTDGDDFTVFVFCKHIIFFCRPISSDRNPRWRSQSIMIEGRQARVGRATTCNGLIYASTSDNDGRRQRLITIKASTNGSSISITPLELKVPDSIDPKQIGSTGFHMLESCGQVYYVIFTVSDQPRINTVEIWELDLDKKIWVEVKSLNNRAFFLGHYFCTWCWATTDSQIEPNSVYIPNDFDDRIDNDILFKYSLQHRSFTVYFPCPDLQSSCIQRFWFIPQGSNSRRSLKRVQPKKASVDILHKNADIVDYPNKLLPKQNEIAGNILKHLPLDMIELISKYLFCFDYLDFRAACKTFQSTLPHGRCQWRRNYNSSLPFFVSLSNSKGWLKVVDPFRNKSCYIAIPESQKSLYSIDYCKDGWLILYCGGECFQFFNLFTRTWGNLPPHEDMMCNILSIGVSTCIGSSDCVIVRINKYPNTIKYTRYTDKDWKLFVLEEEEEEEEGEENRFNPSNCHPVYRNGGFFFLDRKGCVGVFQLVGENPTWQVYERPKTRGTQFHSCHLVECDGQLFSVFIGMLGKWIQVFRFDDNEKVWNNVKSLGNYAFFISPASSISTVAEEVGMGNRIYLPRLHGKGFIFYSLQTRKYHVVGTDLVIDCFCPSEEPFECCWA